MAATLTGAGLLLLLLQRRIERSSAAGQRRGGMVGGLARLGTRVQSATPAATAALVLVVGLGIAARAAVAVV
jgi:hypothetical protein